MNCFIVFRGLCCLTGENELEMETKEQRFSRVVEEYKRTIYTVCYMFSKDEDEVNDLFQEILIRLWQGFDSFEGKSDIKTWIYRVSLNYCINYDKKQKRAGERVDLDMDIKPYEDNYEKSLQVKRLYKRINALMRIIMRNPCRSNASTKESMLLVLWTEVSSCCGSKA